MSEHLFHTAAQISCTISSWTSSLLTSNLYRITPFCSKYGSGTPPVSSLQKPQSYVFTQYPVLFACPFLPRFGGKPSQTAAASLVPADKKRCNGGGGNNLAQRQGVFRRLPRTEQFVYEQLKVVRNILQATIIRKALLSFPA
jgi:hypothetical protein